MLVKKHKAQDRLILAVCDKDLIGETFEEGNMFLNIKPSFYEGEEMSEEEVIKIIRTAYIINAVGRNTISMLLKNNIIKQEDITTVEKIPHVQVVFELPEPSA